MILWVFSAWALEPEVGVHALSGISNTSDGVPLLFGLGGQVAIDPLRRLHIEVAADAGVTTAGSVWAGFGPRVRLFAGPPEKTVLSAFAGGGLGVGSRGPRALVEAGFAVDLLRSNGPRPRLHATYAWEVQSAARLLIGVGAVFGRKAPPVVEPPPPEPTPVPVPEPVPEPAQIKHDEAGMIWVPGPACMWMPTSAGKAEIDRLGMVLTSITAISPRTISDPNFDPSTAAPPPEPRPGRIAVSAYPGDLIRLGGTMHPVSDEMVVVEHKDGRADLVVTGGGRVATYTVGVTQDNVVWIDALEPEPTRVLFANNSSTLDTAARKTIVDFAESIAGWRIELHGSASPEGNPSGNRRLAEARARSVMDALVEAGVMADQVIFGEPKPPAPGLAAQQQRNATLTPRPPQ